jgi:hypothetical protein
MTNEAVNNFIEKYSVLFSREFTMSDFSLCFVWVVSHHLTTYTEVENLRNNHFSGDLRIIFSGTKNYIQTFCFNV